MHGARELCIQATVSRAWRELSSVYLASHCKHNTTSASPADRRYNTLLLARLLQAAIPLRELHLCHLAPPPAHLRAFFSRCVLRKTIKTLCIDHSILHKAWDAFLYNCVVGSLFDVRRVVVEGIGRHAGAHLLYRAILRAFGNTLQSLHFEACHVPPSIVRVLLRCAPRCYSLGIQGQPGKNFFYETHEIDELLKFLHELLPNLRHFGFCLPFLNFQGSTIPKLSMLFTPMPHCNYQLESLELSTPDPHHQLPPLLQRLFGEHAHLRRLQVQTQQYSSHHAGSLLLSHTRAVLAAS